MSRNLSWSMECHTFSNCNFDIAGKGQSRLEGGPCQYLEAGYLVGGHFNETPLAGLNWVFVGAWPNDMAEGDGREVIAIDERANHDQRQALRQILMGQAGEPGSNHFSVVSSLCSSVPEPKYLPIHFEIDVEGCKANLEVVDVLTAKGEPADPAGDIEPFHIAFTRPICGFEFTYQRIGMGTAAVSGQTVLNLSSVPAQFCIHHYDQDGLVAA